MIRDTEPSSQTKIETRGCIDLGSTNFRLLVVEGAFRAGEAGRRGVSTIRSIRESRRLVAWGDDLARTGRVSAAKERTASRALGELLDEAAARGCRGPDVVATNTLREAANAREVASALEAAHRVSIRVLSPREEASYGYAGASFFIAGDGAISLVDAGGTSTEISWGRGTSIEGWTALPLGTHRVERMLAAGGGERLASARLADALAVAGVRRSARADVYRLPAFARDSTMLLTGGTAVSLAVYVRYLSGGAGAFEEMIPLTRGDVALARRRLAGIRDAGRERRLPLEAGRIGLFPAGLILIDAVLAAAGIERFRVTARDLRWGVVLTGGASG
jgi:exopolyphosphatase/guanosine-5'-triphosphate,3'-diphosphate pyrophosphatase